MLSRVPNAPIPPPFLRADIIAANEYGQNTDAAMQTNDDSVVYATYYGEGDGDSNSEAGFIAGSTPGGADDAAGTPGDAGSTTDTGVPPPSAEIAQWTQLNGECWTYTTSAYVYSFCPYQNITQKSTSTILHVILGVFDDWIQEEEEIEPVIIPAAGSPAANMPGPEVTTPKMNLLMRFTDGTSCANGKQRSTKVQFVCEPYSIGAGGSRIGAVTEPHTCEYSLRFHTPLMCTPSEIAAAASDPSAATAASDAATIERMQQCIIALYDHTQFGSASSSTAGGASSSLSALPSSVRVSCGSLLPQSRDSFELDQTQTTASTTTTTTTTTTSTPTAHASHPPAASSIEPSLTDGAPATATATATATDANAADHTIRANIPASIIESDATTSSSSPPPFDSSDSPNGAISPEAASSPYAQLDAQHDEL